MAWKLGIEGTLCTGAAGATPTVALEGVCGDLTLNLDPVEASASVREVAFEFSRVVRFKASIEFEMMVDDENEGWESLWAAFTARTAIAAAVDGEGGIYFDGDFGVTIAPAQPHDGFQTSKVTLKPYYNPDHLPTFEGGDDSDSE